MNYEPLITSGVQIASAVLVPVIISYIGLHVKNVDLRDALNTAVQRAPGVFLESLRTAKGEDLAAAHLDAHAAAVSYVNNAVPGAIKSLGVSATRLGAMVAAEVGKTYAAPATVPTALALTIHT